MNNWEFDNIPFDGDLTDDKIVCQNCGWSWKVKDGGDDLYICHKCGFDNESAYSKESYSNFAVDPALIVQGATALAGLGGSIAQASSGKQMSKTELQKEIDTRCGKDKSKGLRRKKVKQEYNDCKNRVLQKLDDEKKLSLEQQQQMQKEQQKKQEVVLNDNKQKQKNITYLIIGIVTLVLGFVAYKKLKK